MVKVLGKKAVVLNCTSFSECSDKTVYLASKSSSKPYIVTCNPTVSYHVKIPVQTVLHCACIVLAVKPGAHLIS